MTHFFEECNWDQEFIEQLLKEITIPVADGAIPSLDSASQDNNLACDCQSKLKR